MPISNVSLLLHQATLAGHAIGQIARLSTGNLKKLLGAEVATVARPHKAASLSNDESPTPALFDACLTAVKRLDPEALKSTLENAEIVLSKPMRIDQFKFNLKYIDGNANLEASQ